MRLNCNVERLCGTAGENRFIDFKTSFSAMEYESAAGYNFVEVVRQYPNKLSRILDVPTTDDYLKRLV